jgi:DNA anti-recombination protein RmuC
MASAEWLNAKFRSGDEFLDFWHQVLTEQKNYVKLQSVLDVYRQSRLLADDAERIGRYQSTLDNELYKALRALREAQTWRLRTIEASSTES